MFSKVFKSFLQANKRRKKQIKNKLISLIAILITITIGISSFNNYAKSGELSSGKIIEWGWETPFPASIKERIREMENTPFDGLVVDLEPNDKKNLHYPGNYGFSWSVWGPNPLKDADFSESIEALQKTDFIKFTDNFLRFNVAPGLIDWYEDEFNAVLNNVRLAASIAKSTRLKGILLDVEHYQGKPFQYASQKFKNEHNFKDYQRKVKQRGREFMQAINEIYPGMTILLSYGYQLAYHTDFYKGSLEAGNYGLLPSFLDGILDAADGKTLIFDGWEFAYCYRNEQQFRDSYDVMRNQNLRRSADRDAFLRHYRASFGIWVDCSPQNWNRNNLSSNYFSPKGFESSVRSALKYTDRYVWIYSQKAGWWDGQMPQPYIDALRNARQP